MKGTVLGREWAHRVCDCLVVRLGDARLDIGVFFAIALADLSHQFGRVLAQSPVVVRRVLTELRAKHTCQNSRNQLVQLQKIHTLPQQIRLTNPPRTKNPKNDHVHRAPHADSGSRVDSDTLA